MSERFWAKVDKTSGPCWIWTARINYGGYGQFRTTGRLTEYAHRVSWKLHGGPIPAGMDVLHRCDRPACVNPGHLFLGTDADNVSDRNAKGRQARGERAGRSKLKSAQVAEIKSIRIATGMSMRKLASLFGVSHTTIEQILDGQIWKSEGVPCQ